MKKILLLLTLLLSFTLVACNNEEEAYVVTEVTFNGQTYQYMKTENHYDIFVSNGHTIEIQYGRITTITTEIGADIYIIKGEKTDYTITRNGETLLICSGEEVTCTGHENVDFKLDIIGIIEEYEKE